MKANEVNPSLVLSWLKIEEGSVDDLKRDLAKQPLRTALVQARVDTERQKLADLENELRMKQLDLDTYVSKRVVEFRESGKAKSETAVTNYRKFDLEADPKVINYKTKINELRKAVADQENLVRSWEGLMARLREKTMILLSRIKLEIYLAKGVDSIMEEI